MTKRADTKPLREKLERAAAPNDLTTFYELLERSTPDLGRALPPGSSLDAFTRTAVAEVRRSPELLDCTPESVLGGLVLAARLGLEPGPLGLVYLVPRDGLVAFVVGYRGLVALAYRSGQVKDVDAGLVFEGEPFEFRKGTRPFLDHSPAGSSGSHELVAAYAVARLRSGGAVFEVIYPEQWEAARKASPTSSAEGSPWREHPQAMIRKTAVLRLAPMLPQAALLEQAARRDELPAPTPAELLDSGEAS
jgi:recombination protein RecT